MDLYLQRNKSRRSKNVDGGKTCGRNSETNFLVTDGTGIWIDDPSTKWIQKMKTDFKFNFCCEDVITGLNFEVDSVYNAQRGEKMIPNYFYVPKSCNICSVYFLSNFDSS